MRESQLHKLHLNRESLRILSEDDLGAIQGGKSRTTFPSICDNPTLYPTVPHVGVCERQPMP